MTAATSSAKAPTGSGKTLAFGLPIVDMISADEPAPVALILAPTRELALQVTEELSLLGGPHEIRSAAAYGGAPVAARAKKLQGANVVVVTPGRLNDLIQRRLISPASPMSWTATPSSSRTAGAFGSSRSTRLR